MKWQSKKDNKIVFAEIYKPGMEDGKQQGKPYVLAWNAGRLHKIVVDRRKYIIKSIYKGVEYKFVMPSLMFLRLYKKVEE